MVGSRSISFFYILVGASHLGSCDAMALSMAVLYWGRKSLLSRKWLMLDDSDLGNGRWYITLALFSISLGPTLIPQENNARANVWGLKRPAVSWAVQKYQSANKHGIMACFLIFLSCYHFFLFLFLAGGVLATMF